MFYDSSSSLRIACTGSSLATTRAFPLLRLESSELILCVLAGFKTVHLIRLLYSVWRLLTCELVIPGTSKIAFGARAPTMVELEKLKTRVEACFEAGALATGCTYTTSKGMCYYGELPSTWLCSPLNPVIPDLRNNEGLSGTYKNYMTSRFGVEFPHVDNIGGSTDFVSLRDAVFAPLADSSLPQGNGESSSPNPPAILTLIASLSLVRNPRPPPRFRHPLRSRRSKPHGWIHQGLRDGRGAHVHPECYQGDRSDCVAGTGG